MVSKNKQAGVGLIEVLVAILLLAVAVLGFSTLQMTSVKATDESLKRTQAMSVARGLSESLRVNVEQAETVMNVINGTISVTNGSLNQTCKYLSDTCTSVDIAKKDADMIKQNANKYDIRIGMEECPGTTNINNPFLTTHCIVVAWDDTNEFTDASSRKNAVNVNCADANGAYYPDADCIIVEAY